MTQRLSRVVQRGCDGMFSTQGTAKESVEHDALTQQGQADRRELNHQGYQGHQERKDPKDRKKFSLIFLVFLLSLVVPFL